MTCQDLKTDLTEEEIQQAINDVDMDGEKSEGNSTLNFEVCAASKFVGTNSAESCCSE